MTQGDAGVTGLTREWRLRQLFPSRRSMHFRVWAGVGLALLVFFLGLIILGSFSKASQLVLLLSRTPDSRYSYVMVSVVAGGCDVDITQLQVVDLQAARIWADLRNRQSRLLMHQARLWGTAQYPKPPETAAYSRYAAGFGWYAEDRVADSRGVPAMRVIRHGVIVPAYLFLPAALALLAFLVSAPVKRLRRLRAGRCADCGYDHSHTRERCPECGKPLLGH